MNPLILNKLKEFDTFIDSLPSRVGETPKEVLKEWLEAALQDIEKKAYEKGFLDGKTKRLVETDEALLARVNQLKQEYGL